MLKDITLGQYFPGNSPLHRMDPRTKLVGVVAFIAVLFTARGIAAFGLCLVFTALAVGISQIKLSLIAKSLKPVVVLVLFTAVLNLLYTPGDEIFHWWIITITRQGLEQAAYMTLKILLLISLSSLLTYTTSPMALTDGIERLLAPLKKIKVPVHEFAMMMTIALRFIPTLIEETDKIISAQRSRGADFDSGNIIRRAKALIPVLIPLFISADRRAGDLALAMECRLYRGDVGRTRLNVLRFKRIDALSLLALMAFCAAVVAAGRFIA